MAGPSGFLDRLLDDSTELRGQRLWVMFSLSVVLVAGMNAYAMLREPELVEIGDIIEHTNEVVSVEGVVISWVEDPYDQGEKRVDIIIEDETGVVELRWYRFGEIPMLGTEVKAVGDVIEYEGRLWLQALGAGALSWDEEDIPDAPVIAISSIAANPESFLTESVTITGYLSKSVSPNASFTALYLGDHPNYGNSEHQIRMIIHSAPGQWLESGQKVEVTAVIQYAQRELRWSLHVQGPEVRVIRTHVPEPTTLTWDVSSWSYSSGNLVEIDGTIMGDHIVGPNGAAACLSNAGDLSEYNGSKVTFAGRLLWSTSAGEWCIDASNSGGGSLIDPDDASNLLFELTSNPIETLHAIENNTHYLITGFAYGAELMSSTGDTTIIVADGIYPSINAKVDAYVPLGLHSGWLEDGQSLVLNVTAQWSNPSAEIQLIVHSMTLDGGAPMPAGYSLSEGAPEWYDLDKKTKITGNLVTIENQTWLQQEGGDARIIIDVVPNSIGADSIHSNMTLSWTGRLIEIPNDTELSHEYVLSNADVTDTDGDGLSDDAEQALGYDMNSADSDGDGTNDRDEVIANQN
ncbi:MAG: hypothetical protein QGI21_05990 [Candidatus Poseidoniaceae archaeon]|jgi:hypothetical protein|nr:hypothetical protein [Candidatus Poseidoniaceae archaeon]